MPQHPLPMGQRKLQVTRLWEKHHEIKRLLLIGLGNKEIATIIGCTPQSVCNVRNSDIFRVEMAVCQTARDNAAIDVARVLKEDAGKSLSLLQEIRDGKLEGTPLGLRAKVAMDMLDRAGFAPVKKVEGKFLTGKFSPEDIDELKNRVREAKNLAISNGVISEAEIVEEV